MSNREKFLIVGGSGQFGLTLSKLLLKKNDVTITSRNLKILKKKIKEYKIKNLKISKLNIFDKTQISKILKNEYKYVFYFAGQSSPSISYKKPNVTIESNYKGCKNFLEEIRKKKYNLKFINASSSEIFANSVKKINIGSKKKPISPYGTSKLLSFKETKKYREKHHLKSYNAVIFNTESIYRKRNYLIPKICIAALNSKLKKTKTQFGNLNIIREWNWCDEQCFKLIKMIKLKPNDYILSNGKPYSAFKMLNFAFQYFNLNYKDYVNISSKFFRKKDFEKRISGKNKVIRFKSKIFGKKIIHKLLKYYLKNEF